ncbi:Hypothetical predicted protein [Mytilus galloprovincialis]|uniref:Uncharacterized protein n=1 Tax=Mytilus galloprovincialis TaxID=29158 RepID=A0A8B6G796_MYTGA|nr:Hypothetical predicted protein [Mytilus galloprovincialis]
MWRSRETGIDGGLFHSALALGLTSSTIFAGLENVVSGNGGVYRWVTLGPHPPHLTEERPTPATGGALITGALVIRVFFPGHSPCKQQIKRDNSRLVFNHFVIKGRTST